MLLHSAVYQGDFFVPYKGIEIDISNLDVVPSIEGNAGFKVKGPRIQHPLTTLEIICWDSSEVLFLSKDKDLAVFQ
jgi:hypothetical protein